MTLFLRFLFFDNIFVTLLSVPPPTIIYTKSENLFFGKLIWLKEPKDINGKFKTDKNNPNKNLRNEKLLGLKILSNLMWNNKEKEWINGSIYNARDGKTYQVFANLSEKKLKLRGYIGFSLFGKTTIWTKSNLIN